VFAISVDLLSNGKINPISIKIDHDLFDALGIVSSKKWFVERITDVNDIDDLPAVIEDIMREIGSSNHIPHTPIRNSAQLIIGEIDILGWNCFAGISEDLRCLKLSLQDSSKRTHAVELYCPDDYPDTIPLIRLSVPFEVVVDWTWQRSISHVVNSIYRDLNAYGSYFTVMKFIRFSKPFCPHLSLYSPWMIILYHRFTHRLWTTLILAVWFWSPLLPPTPSPSAASPCHALAPSRSPSAHPSHWR
jgi:hypothetical protein